MKKEKITIWHKSSCAKSCEVMKVMKSAGVLPEVFEYLLTPPTEEELKSVLKKLGIPAEELIRKKEKIYKEKFEGKKMTEEKWIKAMVKHPILIERPILVKGNKAIVGRPTERVFEIIGKK